MSRAALEIALGAAKFVKTEGAIIWQYLKVENAPPGTSSLLAGPLGKQLEGIADNAANSVINIIDGQIKSIDLAIAKKIKEKEDAIKAQQEKEKAEELKRVAERKKAAEATAKKAAEDAKKAAAEAKKKEDEAKAKKPDKPKTEPKKKKK